MSTVADTLNLWKTASVLLEISPNRDGFMRDYLSHLNNIGNALCEEKKLSKLAMGNLPTTTVLTPNAEKAYQDAKKWLEGQSP